MPEESVLASWAPMMQRAGVKSGKPFDIASRTKAAIEAVVFVNVREKEYEIPPWRVDPEYSLEGGRQTQ